MQVELKIYVFLPLNGGKKESGRIFWSTLRTDSRITDSGGLLPMKCLRNEDFVESNFGGFLLQVFELPELLIIPERILEFRFHNLCVITIYSIILLRKW